MFLRSQLLFLCFFSAFLPGSADPIIVDEHILPVVILGGGMGALSSSIYLGRAELSPVVIQGSIPGGLLTQSHSVQNWPGEIEIEGQLLTDKMKKQAEACGAIFLQEEVVSVDFSSKPLKITTRLVSNPQKTRTILTQSCIIAMGTTPNYLHVEGEKQYWGKGVTNCAICDGNLYKGKAVVVAGGGDAAILEALYLSNIASKVTVLVRKNQFKATELKRLETLLQKSNIEVLYNTEVLSIRGNGDHVESLEVLELGKKNRQIKASALFLAIGSKPNTALFKGVLDLDSQGYIKLKNGQQTCINGVYAVGDIVDPVFKQAISAAGDGAKAALQVQQFISDRNFGLAKKDFANSSRLIVQNTVEEKKASDGKVIEIKSDTQFRSQLKESEIPIVVDFYASWCGPCQRLSPSLNDAAIRLNGKVKFLKVNVDKIPSLVEMYRIRSMPTAVLISPGGKEIDRRTGLGPIVELLDGLK